MNRPLYALAGPICRVIKIKYVYTVEKAGGWLGGKNVTVNNRRRNGNIVESWLHPW
jgi:hypothetical protein